MSKDAAGPLVVELEKRRRALGLGHSAFAARIGMSRQHWHFLRRGQRGFGLTAAGRVLKEWPELGYFLNAEATRQAGAAA